MDLLEVQTWVKGILTKKSIGLASLSLDVGW